MTWRKAPLRSGNVRIDNSFRGMLFKKLIIGKSKIFKESFAFAEFGVCTFAGFKCNASFRKPPLNLVNKLGAASLHYVCFIDENDALKSRRKDNPPLQQHLQPFLHRYHAGFVPASWSIQFSTFNESAVTALFSLRVRP